MDRKVDLGLGSGILGLGRACLDAAAEVQRVGEGAFDCFFLGFLVEIGEFERGEIHHPKLFSRLDF
jgi:hypothetical protein